MTNENPYKNEQEELEQSISYGVSHDRVNLGTVSFWIVLGTLLVTVILYGLYQMYSYNQFLAVQQAAIQSEFHELENLRRQEHQLLHSFEIVDEEEGRYRIPIDSAMNLIVTDRN